MTFERCDVVVIGAGLGGLAAAATLAREGASVLLVERHAQPGGYASSFRRGPFEFEVSLHLMDAVGPGEPGWVLLESLGVALDFAEPRILRRELGPGHDLEIPRGRRELERVIAERYPDQIAAFSELLELGERAQKASLELDGGAPRGLQETLELLGPLARVSAAEVIDAKIGDPKLRDVLERFAIGWLGRSLPALRAPELLVPWYSYHALGGGYPIGGSAALANALVQVIERAGGEVALSCAARRIAVERHRAEAVELEDGRRVSCNAVVSNVCPSVTFGSLIDPAELPGAERARYQRLRPSLSCFKVWIGTHRPIESPAYEVDLTATVPGPRDRLDPRTGRLSVVVPSALGRGFSEPEGRVLSVSTLVRPEQMEGAGTREELGEAVIVRLERELFPGLSTNIAAMEIATPQTFEKFTGNPLGAIYGGSIRGGALDGWRPPARTPIDRLFLTGAWTQPGAGFTTVLRSGRRAAREVMHARR